jgi:myo-inositol 2-dehydrogenase / D-chiro-inositol 1-dehydrogenase
MSTVKLGVIGCGKVVSSIHLEALRHIRHARVTAVADPLEERRLLVAARCGGAAAFSDWRQLLEQSDVQAVLICTPSADHAECAIQAFVQGKHVYLEKPIASSPAQAETVLQAWQAAGLLGMMGFNYRRHPLFVKARETVNSGLLGKIIGVESSFTSSGAWVHDWKKKRASAGGVLFDLATHHIDLVHYVFGQPVAEVSAQLASKKSEQDTAWLRMTLKDGIVVQSFFCLYGTDTNRFEIYGESARLTVDYVAKTFQIVNRGSTPVERIASRLSQEASRLKNALASRRDPSYETALASFVNAIASGQRQIQPDLRDGWRVSLVIDAAERSAESCRCQQVAAYPSA